MLANNGAIGGHCGDPSLSVTGAGRAACSTLASSAGGTQKPSCPHWEPRGGAHFFRGACLPLTGFFRACLAMAALGESQDEVGVLGGSAASGFWFGKGARGPLLASLIFSSSDFTALRVAFPVLLFSVGRERRKAGLYSRRPVAQCPDGL